MNAMRTGEWNTFDSVVGRVGAILGAFDSKHLTMGISALSRRSGLPKSTTARLAAELTTHGFLERADSADVRLGTKLFELGELAFRQRKLREVALPYMADLRQVSRQTVHLAVLSGIDVVYVEIVRHRDAPRMPSQVGGRLPAHAAAVGKAMLAFSADDVVQAVVDHGLPAVGPRTITAPGLLLRELRRIRDSGIAYESEESGHGIGCAASPILSADGVAVAGLSISGWHGKLDVRRIGPAVKTAALALSRELQAHPPAAIQ
jgi:IclR family transcriptional regulator, acetate operon repressor